MTKTEYFIAKEMVEMLRNDNICVSRKLLHDAADFIEKHNNVEKHGTWKTAYLDHEACGVRPMVLYCSECNQAIAFSTKYCPNCGADMT